MARTRTRSTDTGPSPARALFERATAGVRTRADVSEGVMLHSPGLRVGGSFFAFVGSGESVIVKVRRDRAEALVAGGSATRVTLGTRTLREWVELPMPADGDPAPWTTVVEEACAYVAAQHEAAPA